MGYKLLFLFQDDITCAITATYFADEILRIRTQLQRVIFSYTATETYRINDPITYEKNLIVVSVTVLPILPVTAVRTSLSIWYFSLWSRGRIFSKTFNSIHYI